MERFNSVIFDLAPIPMWLEDFSAVITRLDALKAQGVTDLAAYLAEHPEEVLACAHSVDILKVNQKTLALLKAKDLAEIKANLSTIFPAEMVPWHIAQLVAIWNRQLEFIGDTVNHNLQGERLDLQVRGFVLPEYQQDFSHVFITTEDISAYKNMLRLEAHNREIAETLFQSSPAALLLYDLTAVKICLEQLDLHSSTAKQHSKILACLNHLDLIKANQTALQLMQVKDLNELKCNLNTIFSQDAFKHFFCDALWALWQGQEQQQGEGQFLGLDGKIYDVYLQFNIFPSEPKWQLLQIALTDISTQKQAEQLLQKLSKCDSLTGLYNHRQYLEEIDKLNQHPPSSLSCIYLDLNHLKPVNDQYGHDVGDQLLKRAGRLLENFVADQAFFVARLGGDEFIILMPDINPDQLLKQVSQLKAQIAQDQQQHEPTLNFSIGVATQLPHESIHSMLQRADQNMYLDKKRYYQQNPHYERRKNR